MTSKRPCLSREMVERGVAVLVLLVDQHRMALREGAALASPGRLSRTVMAFQQQRAERQRLGGRPVDALPGLDRLAARIEEALDGAVDVEALRHRGELLAHVLQRLDRDAGVAAARIVDRAGDLHAGPAAVEPVGVVGLVALARLLLGVEPVRASRPSSSRPRPR